MTTPILFFGHEIYRKSGCGEKHPLSIPRVSICIDLCRAMGWLPDAAYVDSPQASVAEMARFHCPDYLAALQAAERDGAVSPDVVARYNVGGFENPVFPEVFRRPAIGAGAGIAAARLLAAAERGAIYSPASGAHHARRDRASGFCYVNAPVLAVSALLDAGLSRVLYIDLDAHHGDGVEEAFFDDPRVVTVSVHEAGRWPFTGPAGRCGVEGSAVNFPVQAGFNDAELAYVVEKALLPLAHRFDPDALVLQTGADALADDPLSRLSLSNLGYWSAVRRLKDAAPRLLCVGGGGYNPWSAGRAWAGVWAVLNDLEPERAEPTPAALDVLAALTWHRAAGRNPPERWLKRLCDEPQNGGVRTTTADMVNFVASMF